MGGLKKKHLIITGVVTAAVWAFAIQTGSVIFMIIVGVLTLLLAAILIWALRMNRKQMGLVNLLQSATQSPEQRRAVLAQLEASKDANDLTHVFLRAQLLAAEDPKRALELLEAHDVKKFQPQMQDDVAILRSQLYLNFGRPKDARPLVDRVNVDSTQRAEMRGLMVSVVAQAWARTGRHVDAAALIDTVDLTKEQNEEVRIQLMVARVFARFAAGKRGPAKDDLKALANLDVNHLGRILAPQLRVHPELQRLAREVAEQSGKLKREMRPGERRGRPR